ncbi:hypothetical protein Deba_0123 [Desulfarculus baarsii DSM 2075]|uniref:MetS family NSS transporter small subunit n=1 Tax=Desulfarculus baarsii (strain ATCC 33931 / DSM 2075 / LMG 7858 / VKM B-1802 / 2st14) TaxID=644282 RepID=E1QDI3_DESB2|nr:hypothetical protein Deba_0123 [Desulfarculus baarsii DSM 2075]
MSLGAIITMVLGLTITWGGVAWCLRRAIKASPRRRARRSDQS